MSYQLKNSGTGHTRAHSQNLSRGVCPTQWDFVLWSNEITTKLNSSYPSGLPWNFLLFHCSIWLTLPTIRSNKFPIRSNSQSIQIDLMETERACAFLVNQFRQRSTLIEVENVVNRCYNSRRTTSCEEINQNIRKLPLSLSTDDTEMTSPSIFLKY